MRDSFYSASVITNYKMNMDFRVHNEFWGCDFGLCTHRDMCANKLNRTGTWHLDWVPAGRCAYCRCVAVDSETHMLPNASHAGMPAAKNRQVNSGQSVFIVFLTCLRCF